MRAPRKLQDRDAGARIERSEDTVRFVISIIAALMILSLAACRRVSAENAHDARTEDEFGFARQSRMA